jgi:uncharacterized protein YndB with AHSA1/START domain
MSAQLSKRQPAEFELSISRLIDAPRTRIFRAWTEPQLLAQWWGPHGMTTPECEMDLWVGGQFRTLMRAPDGSEYPTQGVYLEIVAPQRIVFTDAFKPGWTEEDRQAHEAMGFHDGWGQSLDRLVTLVTEGMRD